MRRSASLALIPARSGSKGLPGKNIKSLCGKPLLTYSVEQAQESGVFDDIVVSTDSEEYATIARDVGAWVPFLRPEQLAQDSSRALDVYVDVLDRLEYEHNRTYDTLFVLQPTSPLRRASDIQSAHRQLAAGKVKALVGISRLEHPLAWVGRPAEDGCMADFVDSGVQTMNRQEFQVCYRLNGYLFAAEVSYFRSQGGFLGPHTYAFEVDRRCGVDIDDEIDFAFAEFLLGRMAGREDS
jgi:CMP-N-acetylneuraminic acid synthetase